MNKQTQSQETSNKNTTEAEISYSDEGIVFDIGSLCASYSRLVDGRKARGKRYSLVTMLLLMTLAKLCGHDTPEAMADWARQRSEGLAELLKLNRASMPHATTYGRVLRKARIARMEPDPPSQAKHTAYPSRIGGRRFAIRPTTKDGESETTEDTSITR